MRTFAGCRTWHDGGHGTEYNLGTKMVQMNYFEERQATTFETSRGLNSVVKIVMTMTTLSPMTITTSTTCDYNKKPYG